MDAAEKATEALMALQRQLPEVYGKYLEFTSQLAATGPLQSKMLELVLVGCSLMSQCEMCISIHVQGAASAGASREEILQAACMAVAMGGSPKLMYLKYVFEELDDLFD